jgi:6,7-dimethyl-8-ribityllumazine synthase
MANENLQTRVPGTRNIGSGSAPRVAFVQAGWHREIVEQCKGSFENAMKTKGFGAGDIDFFEVPGVFELPLHAKLLAMQDRYAAIVAAGLVVDGGIYRHDFVSTAVINGLMQVQLETLVPVLSVVLTPHHFHGSDEHVSFFRDHFVIKGSEAASACADIIARTRRFGPAYATAERRSLSCA